MNSKLIDQYLIIEKAIEAGICDDEEIVRIISEATSMSEDGAIMALASFYDDQKEIKNYIKKNGLLNSKKFPQQMGE